MKNIVMDSSSVISLTLNNMLWVLEELRHYLDGDFYIPPAVKAELVEHPLNTKRFEFEALQVLAHINQGTLKVAELNSESKALYDELLNLANTSFKSKGVWINIVHSGEIQALAVAVANKASAFCVDERTTTLLIENPAALKSLLQSKLHSRVEVNRENINRFKSLIRGIRVVRSVELMLVAYEKGILNRYLPADIPEARQVLLDGILWGLKLRGCAISEHEIAQLKRIEANFTA
ncbi:MAG: hypothetical protein QXW00_02260 [Candidatus Woesearchaeota archaeon]